MPVRWTPENDQTLLLKILETHELVVDTKKVAAAWPSDKGKNTIPTPRAITERLVRMRHLAREKGDGNFSISKNNSSSSSPRKPRRAPIISSPGSESKRNATSIKKETDEIGLHVETPTKTG